MIMNKLKDWRLLFIVGALLSYSLLLMTMMNDFYELPSDGFSKEVFLRSYAKQNTYEAYDDRNFTSGKLDHGWYLLLNDGDRLVYESYSAEGKLMNSYTVKEGIEAVVDMASTIVNDDLHYIFLTADELYYGAIALSNGQVIEDVLVDSHLDSAILHEAAAVYSKNDDFYYYDGVSQVLFEDQTIQQYDFFVNKEELYITTISRNAGPFYTDFYKIDLNDGLVQKTELKSYITANATKDADHKIVLSDGKARSMSIFRDSKTSNTYYKELQYDLEQPEAFEFSKFEMTDFPNFRYKVNDDDSVSMMLEQFTFVGKTELASAGSTYRNLVEIKDIDGERNVTKLTKMKKSHPTYDFFEVEGEDYIIFNTVDREMNSSEGSLYFATSLPSVVASSNNMTFDNFKELLFGALTVIPAALAVGFIPSMGFLFPVIVVIMPLSMIKITWTEHHPEKLLRAAIIVYAISIMMGFYESASKIMSSMQLMSGYIPWHLHSISRMYGVLAITFLISYLAHKWFARKKADANFMIKFGIMFICQSMFYIMLFHAYPLLAN